MSDEPHADHDRDDLRQQWRHLPPRVQPEDMIPMVPVDEPTPKELESPAPTWGEMAARYTPRIV
jgi:hypothetical protein